MEGEISMSWGVKPFVFLLAAENSVGAVRRTYVCTAKGIPGPLTCWWKLAVFALHRACCGPWHSTRSEIFVSLAFTLFSPRSTTHVLTLPMEDRYPWKEPCSRASGRLCPALLWWCVIHHCCVFCFCLSHGLLVSSLAHLTVCCVLSNGTRQRADLWGAFH